MARNALESIFRQIARWVGYLILALAATGMLLLGGRQFPQLMSPLSTTGGLMLIVLILLALLVFLVLIYLVPRAAIELYQQPRARTLSNWASFVAGLIALMLLATWLSGGFVPRESLT